MSETHSDDVDPDKFQALVARAQKADRIAELERGLASEKARHEAFANDIERTFELRKAGEIEMIEEATKELQEQLAATIQQRDAALADADRLAVALERYDIDCDLAAETDEAQITVTLEDQKALRQALSEYRGRARK
jgi:hypothetical protein